jgi:hypothetical protein
VCLFFIENVPCAHIGPSDSHSNWISFRGAGHRQLHLLQALALISGEHVPLLRVAVVEELGVDALLMSATLLGHGVAHPHERPDPLDMLRGYPRLREPLDHQ